MPHSTDTGLVGRDRELGDLVGWLDRAAEGRGRMVLIGGAPGIGKSRLASELADIARKRDLLVVTGRGWADVGARPYWPWVQVLRTYLRATSPEDARAIAGANAEELAHLVAEIGVTPAERAPDEDPNSARFRLFDAVATFLRDVADRRTLVVILEDLHAADTASLLLLRFLASQLADIPMLVIGTYRDPELAPSDSRAVAIDQLRRDPNTVAMPLAGLRAADAARMVASSTGSRPDPGVVRALWRETHGNPLFLAHAARLLDAEGRLARPGGAVEGIGRVVPTEVREVILRRAEQLSPDAIPVLSHAAVVGPEFDADTLRRLLDLPTHEVVRHLDDAAAAGLVSDVVGSPGRYRFVHDLVRESLGDVLPPAQRLDLHLRIVETIESLHGDDLASHAPALAYHALEAARGDLFDRTSDRAADLARRAIAYARRAGDEATRSFAWEEAARLYRTAIAVGDGARAFDDRLRFDMLMSHGEAESRGGSLDVAREVFAEAVEMGRRMGSPRDIAAAVIGYSGRLVWARAGDDPRLVSLLREALVMLGGDDDSVRARLLVRLACALRGQPGAHQESDALSRQAVELARALDDDLTLTYVLGGRAWAIWWPDNTVERVEIAREMLEIARRAEDSERIVDAHTMLSLSYMELGQLDRARAEIAEIDRVAGTIRQPVQRWLGIGQRAAVELSVGNFTDAERLIAGVDEDAPVTHGRDDVSAARIHRFLIARERGDVADVESILRASVRELPWYPFHRGALAIALVDMGRRDEAQAVVDDLARDDFAAFVEDNEWLLGVSLAAEAIARLEDRTLGQRVYELLLPRAGRHAFGSPEGSVGVTDRYLGLLSVALGDIDGAVRHLEDAVSRNAAMGLRPWTAHAQADLADALERRGATGDVERVAALREEALAAARALGMPVLERRLTDRPQRDTAVPADGPAVHASTFRPEGEYWTVSYEGTTTRLRDSRGLQHLARLLRVPGQELHALDLAGGLGADGGSADRRFADPETGGFGIDDGTGAGPLLDDAAKAAYRGRLDELREELADAERWNDAERASRADEEIQALTAELSSAVGLGGRNRSVASNAERARISVTRAIRSAIGRIGEQNTALGHHLDATVRTGTYCSYRPDPRAPVEWDLG